MQTSTTEKTIIYLVSAYTVPDKIRIIIISPKFDMNTRNHKTIEGTFLSFIRRVDYKLLLTFW